MQHDENKVRTRTCKNRFTGCVIASFGCLFSKGTKKHDETGKRKATTKTAIGPSGIEIPQAPSKFFKGFRERKIACLYAADRTDSPKEQIRVPV